MKKHVKIIGLSINSKFGGLEAVNLTFDPNNKLTVVKGEVGSGKTTLNKSLGLVTKGSQTLGDNQLYGDDVDLTAQLLDGSYKVFVNCKSNGKGALNYTTYAIDEDGNKLKDVVIDGKKLTPANYLSSLQNALTWRNDELTSENPTVQRNLLLELFAPQLVEIGVVFDKNHKDYVDSIIDQIEKAKHQRSIMDMKRKEVGGIAEDLKAKGVFYDERRDIKSTVEIDNTIQGLKSKISYAKTNIESARQSELQTLQLSVVDVKEKIRIENEEVLKYNKSVSDVLHEYKSKKLDRDNILKDIKSCLADLEINEIHYSEILNNVISKLTELIKPTSQLKRSVKYNEKGQILSKASEVDALLHGLVTEYYEKATQYVNLMNKPLEEVNTTDLENKLSEAIKSKESIELWNKESESINALHNWKDADAKVKEFNNDYYLKLTGINTGVEGLKIVPDDSNNIHLMYDGSYDPEYFHNSKKELRKLSAYSDTQKPMICLLIQNHLLSKKPKSLPYLWIDKVPIDNKTRALIERMSEELGLWLFVSWTGDFEKSQLKDGELLIENGEVFFNK